MAIQLEVNNDFDSNPAGNNVDVGSGSGRTIFYETMTDSGSDSVTAVSIGGQAMTKVGSAQAGSARYHTMWYLIPSGITGTQTLSVTGNHCCNCIVNVYSGTNQAAPKNFASVSANSNGNVSLSVTANNGDWIVGGGQSNVNIMSVRNNTVNRNPANTPSSNLNFDSNGDSNPTGLFVTLAGAGDYTIIGCAIEPAATGILLDKSSGTISSSTPTIDAGSGSGRTMIFMGQGANGSDSITAVSWNSESFTKLGATQTGANRFQTMWYLIPSGTGSQGAVITGTLDVGIFLTFTGTNQAAPHDFTQLTSGTGTSATISVSGTAAGDWLVGQAANGSAALTLANGNLVGDDSSYRQGIVSTAFPTDMQFGWVGSGSTTRAGNAVALSPTAAGPSGIKTWNGIAIASIKTINGIPTGSIKTINGIT